MKKYLLTLLWAALILALSWGAMAWLFWGQRTVWPTFPPDAAQTTNAAPSLAPQVVVSVERDYGWRTGDRIPVDLFIRQKPGTIVDTSSLAISGDFEILKQPDGLVERELADGSRLIRIHIEIQSLQVKKSLSLLANMDYRVLATREDATVQLPGLTLFTSFTYDGRPDIQQGPLALVFGGDLMYVALLLGLGLAGVIAGTIWLRRVNLAIKNEPVPDVPMTPMNKARHNFRVIWARIAAGDHSEDNYRDLERTLRYLFRIRAKTTAEVDLELDMQGNVFHQEVVIILTECDKVLYQRMYLNEAELKEIHDAFIRIFTAQPAPRLPRFFQAPKPEVPAVWEEIVKTEVAQPAAENTETAPAQADAVTEQLVWPETADGGEPLPPEGEDGDKKDI